MIRSEEIPAIAATQARLGNEQRASLARSRGCLSNRASSVAPTARRMATAQTRTVLQMIRPSVATRDALDQAARS